MIDPDNIKPDTEITVDLPRVITAHDYHEFDAVQQTLHKHCGAESVYVTEVGFRAPVYVALVHLDTASHNQLVMDLTSYYESQEYDPIETDDIPVDEPVYWC